MKIKGVILILMFASCLRLFAQGVLLGPGDTLSIGFNRVNGCFFTEASPGAYVGVAFGNDVLEPGESLRLEMFENSLGDVPFAAQIYSPTTSVAGVNLYGSGSQWLDFQGQVRVSMLSGSVDVDYAHFVVSPDAFTACPITVFVPEPHLAGLFAVGVVLAAAVSVCRHNRATCGRKGCTRRLP